MASMLVKYKIMIQEFPLKGSFDLSLAGTFTDVEVKLFVASSFQTIAIARYVTPASGEYQLTKVGNVYSFDFPDELTNTLLGDYALQINLRDAEGNLLKNGQGSGITYTQKAS